jgi:glucose dehydrogenase
MRRRRNPSIHARVPSALISLTRLASVISMSVAGALAHAFGMRRVLLGGSLFFVMADASHLGTLSR